MFMHETWAYSWAIRNIIAELLMPPSIWILLALLAWVFFRKQSKIKTTLIGLSFVMIWITNTIAFSQWFFQVSNHWMDWPAPLQLTELAKQEEYLKNPQSNTKKNNQAIVILGGGIRAGAKEIPEYQNQDVSSEAITRLRMGARLAKVTDLPILVTGGRPDKVKLDDLPEGQLMAMVLEQELQTPVKWIEDQSNTTQENAQFSAKILKQNQIDTIYLVTHVWHMPRSKMIFEKEELKVIPVPLGYNFKDPFTPLDYFPKGEGLSKTREIWHELLGSIWYRLKF
jgi:uncharacterized SAM-binding protein YcdF (DUF218 family)